MLNKRGLGEEFNWIFIIVAGAIILGFFVMFSFRYLTLEEHKQDLNSIQDFGQVLNTLEKLPIGDKGASIDSNNPDEGLRFGYKLNLNYRCLDDKAVVSINDGKFSNYELKDEILFMEDNKQIDALDMWLLPWRFPYHVTNIIYLAETGKKYYLVYDSNTKDYADSLEISEAFNIEKIGIEKFKSDGESKFVFFTIKEPDIKGIDAVYVNVKDKELSFYNIEKEEWGEPVKYYSEELMFGAFFADNSDDYKCNLNKALNKLKDGGSLIIERVNVLNQVNRNSKCEYKAIADNLRSFVNGNYELKEKIGEQNKAGSGCLWVF